MKIAGLQRLVLQEIKQREEEGCDVAAARERFGEITDGGDTDAAVQLETLLDEVEALDSPLEGREPSGLEAIRALRPDGPRSVTVNLSREQLFDRIHGAWLGRCAGCQLGKPVENLTKEQVRIAAACGPGYPLDSYFRAIADPPPEIADRDWSPANGSLLDGMKGMCRDDDIDYTIVGLRVLERHGFGFHTRDIADYWLENLPFHQVYTAERNAYRNLVNGLAPTEAARYRNPAREWIGAQIRADAFGYTCPGQPERAAELAWRDARLSHTKNGIYGAMMIAAMIATAFATEDTGQIVEAGLAEIPARCRLAAAVRDTYDWRGSDKDWSRTADRIAAHLGHYQGCHTITNAAIVVLGLAYGQNDLEPAITKAVMSGFDTDCNGATAGSIVGAAVGAARLPTKWVKPLGDRVESVVAEVHEARISDLARRTAKLAAQSLGPECDG